MFFSHFCHNYHQNYQNYHHNYHCNHHYHHQKKCRSYPQNVVFDVQKKRTKLPDLGSGGGVQVARAMPKRKRFFSIEVFPYFHLSASHCWQSFFFKWMMQFSTPIYEEEGSTPCPNDIFGPGKCHLPAFDCP